MDGYGRVPTRSAIPVFRRTDIRHSRKAWTQDDQCPSRDSNRVSPEDESSCLGGLIDCEGKNDNVYML